MKNRMSFPPFFPAGWRYVRSVGFTNVWFRPVFQCGG
jgi:hypothetical protein